MPVPATGAIKTGGGAPTVARTSLWAPPIARPLSWAPPTLTSPTVITVDSDPANRFFNAGGGDVKLVMPNTVSQLSVNSSTYLNTALVTVTHARHVVVVGAHFDIPYPAMTAVSSPVGATDTTINVVSTTGFPTCGSIRLDGEWIYYLGVTATSFTGCTRNAFFFTGPFTSNTTHAAGAIAMVSEQARTAFTFYACTGTIHVEGVLIEGAGVCDGIDLTSPGATVQIQNYRCGPNTSVDQSFSTDGHPDCIQVESGPTVLNIDRATLMSYCGRGLLNFGSTGYVNEVTGSGVLRDVEFIGSGPHDHLFNNQDTGTAWECQNVRAQPRAGSSPYTADLVNRIQLVAPGDNPSPFVPASAVGLGYVSPGYL